MAMHYCEKCMKTIDDKQFYTSNNLEKYPPDGKLNVCKKCITMHLDNWDPETYMWILEEVDVPYIKEEWDGLLEKYGSNLKKLTGTTVLGRYLAKMKLAQYNKYRFADGLKIEEERKAMKVHQMKAQGLTKDEIDVALATNHVPEKPVNVQQPVGTPEYDPVDTYDEFDDQLTDEEKMQLKLKWGTGYLTGEMVALEQLYNNYERSYDIQGAGMVDTLIMICKASYRANQLINTGDIEGFQKMTKVYNDLMKSAKLTAAQIKSEDAEGIDSLSELVALCEAEGFIPRYYIDSPKDHVDRTLQDMQSYTRTLVTEELNLGNMIESAVREIESDKARESVMEVDEENMDEESAFEATLFADAPEVNLTSKDYLDFEEFKEEMHNIDEAGEQNGVE